VNKTQGRFLTVAINTPPAENQTQLLEDIATLTGARMISMHKGDKFQDVQLADLGRADRFIAYRDSSAIVKPKAVKKVVDEKLAEIKAAIEAEADPKVKESMSKRLAFFSSKIAVMKVGAATQEEQRALQYKVEDSVNAVKSAYKGGVVPGAGLSLARLRTSSELLNEAFQYPYRQLMDNMSLEREPNLIASKSWAINVRTGKKGPYMQVGVSDPVDVLIAGIESAVSIASLLVTTSGMIVESVVDIKHE
jgi:chaperonin GroEL